MDKYKFDAAKSEDEKIVDKAIDLLDKTIPEQKFDAMDDYVKLQVILNKCSHPAKVELIEMLQELHSMPVRSLHNDFKIQLHSFKEELHSDRLHRELTKNKQLSGINMIKNKHLILLIAVIIGFLLWKK